jgi:hypothetical protein
MIDGLFGLTTGARGKFTNAILMLSTLLAVGMLFAPMLPAGAEKETKKAA